MRALIAVLLGAVLLSAVGCTSAPPEAASASAAPISATGEGSDQSAEDSGEGDGVVRAPEVTLTLLDGSTRALRGDEGRAAVVVFFSSWCTWCVENQAALNDFAAEHRSSVTVIGVAGADTEEAVRTFVEQEGITYPVGLDPDLQLFRAYAVSEPPLVVLISSGGELIRGWPGGVDPRTLAGAVEGLG